MLQVTFQGTQVDDKVKKSLRDLAQTLYALPDAWKGHPVGWDSETTTSRFDPGTGRVYIPGSVARAGESAWGTALYQIDVYEPFALTQPTANDAFRETVFLLDMIRQAEEQDSVTPIPSPVPTPVPTPTPTPTPTPPPKPPPLPPPSRSIAPKPKTGVPWYAWALGVGIVAVTGVTVVVLRRSPAGVAQR